ncbi:MAG: MoxR family ATPase [Myxococcota bacterium]
MPTDSQPPVSAEQLDALRDLTTALRAGIGQVVVGQGDVVEALLIALLAQGHVLMEGPPGTAKTLLARTFSRCLGLGFSRIQFTPDLMPGDVVGTSLFDFQTSRFTLTKGPIFTDFLLADEINRTPPKTQAALLQAMQERQVTIDGETHDLPDDFLVVATQNPIEHEGTYPLPEAQLDRFLLKIDVPYPTRDEERAIVKLHGNQSAMPVLDDFALTPAADRASLAQARATVRNVRLSDEMVDYVVDVVRSTRDHTAVLHGASPRAANMLATASRTRAALNGRAYGIPDDVKAMVRPVLRHRLVLTPAAEVERTTVGQVLTQILESVAAPR